MLAACIPLLVLAAAPIPALEPRAERPVYSVGDQWLLKDGVYELTKIEKNRYTWASSPDGSSPDEGPRPRLGAEGSDLGVDVTPVPEIAWPQGRQVGVDAAGDAPDALAAERHSRSTGLAGESLPKTSAW